MSNLKNSANGAPLPQLDISFFDNRSDNEPKKARFSPDELAARLTNHATRASKDGPAWAPVTFAGSRAKANARELCALVLDYDDGADPVEATRQLDERGVCYILHTTHSHTPDAPKFRIVIPLARTVKAEVWPDFYARATRFFGQGKTDEKCKDASRLYFLPSHPKNRAPDAFSFHFPGDLLDPDDVPTEAQNAPAHAPQPTARRLDEGFRPYVRAAFDGELNRVAHAAKGHRNDTLNRAAFALFQIVAAGELDEASVEGALLDAATGNGLTETEARRTLQSARDAGLKVPRQMPAPKAAQAAATPTERPKSAPSDAQPEITAEARGPYALNEIGNGKRFADANRGRYLYDYPAARWRVYAGGVWRHTDGDDVERAAKIIEAQICAEAKDEADDDRRAKLYKHAASITKRKTRETMLKDAASELGMSAPPENFDAQLHLFNCKNGTLDLRTGELRPHSAPDLLTKCAGTFYDASATAPTWTRALETWIPDAATRDYLQECAGLSLSGEVCDEFFNFLHGEGENGKSTFLATLQTLCGTYHHHTQAETLMKGRDRSDDGGDTPRAGRLALQGARIVTVAEVEAKHQLNTTLVKDMTGRDPISARGLFEKRPTTFFPQFTLWMFGNDKPTIKDPSHGMWRRVRLIEFNQTIPKAERDRNFAQKLKAELSGVLNWALDGLKRVHNNGLIVPEAVSAATASYRAEQSPLDKFIAEACEKSPTAFVTAAEFWGAWKFYCAEMDEPEGTQTAFSADLKRRKIHNARTTISGRQTRIWKGVRLKN